jgi:Cu-processing system permease protein
LITLVVATIYYYHSREFILLLLAQPVRRDALIGGLYLGVAGALSVAFLLGIGLPLLFFYPSGASGVLLLAGLLLSWIFAGLALLVGTHVADKSRGMGVALLLWAGFALLFDGALLLLMYQLAEYPIERPVLFLSFLNPVAIARVLVIMQTEAAALLGLSGAVFRHFFGSAQGSAVAIAALVAWSMLPYYLTKRRFARQDL